MRARQVIGCSACTPGLPRRFLSVEIRRRVAATISHGSSSGGSTSFDDRPAAALFCTTARLRTRSSDRSSTLATCANLMVASIVSCSPDCGSSAPAWRWWPAIRRIHPGRVIWNEHSRVSSPAFTIHLVAKSPSTDESLLEAPSGDATARYFNMARSSSTTIKCNCPRF